MPVASLFGGGGLAFALQSKPNSVWGGVPFGIFAPYRWGPEASDLEGVLKGLVRFGVSQTELGNAVVERYVGAPQARGSWRRSGRRQSRRRRAPPPPVAATSPSPGAIPCKDGKPVALARLPAEAGVARGAQTPEQRRGCERAG